MKGEKKYLQVAAYVEDMIRQGRLTAGERLPSDRALAETLNVTAVTVNKGLNLLVKRNLIFRKIGSGTFVSPKESVRKESFRVGLFIHVAPQANDWYISSVMGQFHEFWKSRNSEVLLLIKSGPEYRKAIEDYSLDAAMILCPEPQLVPFIEDLRAGGFPVATVGSVIAGLEDCAFGVDHRASAEKAVRYLAGLGHTEIGIMLSSNYKTVSIDQCHEGYSAGMWSCKLPLNPAWTLEAGDGPDLEALLRSRKGRGSLPTALLLPYCAHLMPVCSALHAIGVKVPDGISLVGFDDLPEAAHASPPLTVFASPIEALAKGAASYLAALLDGSAASAIQRLYESKLIVRGSCKPISA